jgi:hypothetical protein
LQCIADSVGMHFTGFNSASFQHCPRTDIVVEFTVGLRGIGSLRTLEELQLSSWWRRGVRAVEADQRPRSDVRSVMNIIVNYHAYIDFSFKIF